MTAVNCPFCGQVPTIDGFEREGNFPLRRARCHNCGFAAAAQANTLDAISEWNSLAKTIRPTLGGNRYVVTEVYGTYLVHREGRTDQHAAMHVPTLRLAEEFAKIANELEGQ